MAGVLLQEAEAAKTRGNAQFAKGNFTAAIEEYAEALSAASAHVDVQQKLAGPLYLNRCLCFLKLEQPARAESDADAAIKLLGTDASSVSSRGKAFYRRGLARIGQGKGRLAEQDLEEALGLTPSSEEIKKALKRAQACSVNEDEATSKVAPVNDRVTESQRSDTSLRAGGLDSTSAGPSSSVDAARAFLQRVNDPAHAESSQGPSRTHDPVPEKFPGESGGFLRERSTRLITHENFSASTSYRPSDTQLSPAKSDHQAATAEARNGSPVSRTAASLSFGTRASPSAPIKFSSERKGGSLSAFEFDKRWREIWAAGQGSCGQEHDLNRAFALWGFLGKLDFSKIPNILGSLLEPELLVQLLQGFSHVLRISTQASLGADIQLRDVETQFLVALSALPKCQRFETSLMFLDEQERSSMRDLVRPYANKLDDTIKKSWAGL